MPKEKNIHIIYNSEINLKDWVQDREEIMAESPFCSTCDKKDCENCDSFYYRCEDLNNAYYYDDLDNLNRPLSNNIIALADLGLWNGRKTGFKILGKNLNCIFNISEDRNKYYADGRNVRAECVHHDGTNYILYRKLKDGVTVEQIETLCFKNDYTLTPQQISRYTESLRPYLAEIYGW